MKINETKEDVLESGDVTSGDAAFGVAIFLLIFNVLSLFAFSNDPSNDPSWIINAIFGFVLLIYALFTAKPKDAGDFILLEIGVTIAWTLFLTGISCCSIRHLFKEANTIALIGVSAAFAIPTILLNRLFYWLGKHMNEWTEKWANS